MKTDTHADAQHHDPAKADDRDDFVMTLQRELAFYFGQWHQQLSGHRLDGLACMENQCVQLRKLMLKTQ